MRLEYLTVGWNVIEAIVAVASGLVAKSIALVGFGLDSTVEIFAAGVVIWQLRGVREERDQRALRLIAISFFALAAYVVLQATRDLVIGAEAGESVVGIGLATGSPIALPALGLAKRRTASASTTPPWWPTRPRRCSAPTSRSSSSPAWSSTPPWAGRGPTPSPPSASPPSPCEKVGRPGKRRKNGSPTKASDAQACLPGAGSLQRDVLRGGLCAPGPIGERPLCLVEREPPEPGSA